MTIANKITILIVLLLLALGGNTWLSLRQMGNIRGELAAMVASDEALTEAVTSIHQGQLQKTVLLQRLISIAEEMGFEKTSFARSQYLSDQLKNIQEGMGRYMQTGRGSQQRARGLATAASAMTQDADQQQGLTDIREGLARLEKSQDVYDGLVAKMLNSTKAGGYQLSLEDLEAIDLQQSSLSKDVDELLRQVQALTRLSLAKTAQWESQAQGALLSSLLVTIAIGCLLAWWIVRSIVRPLRSLRSAAAQIGGGQFNITLSTSSRDELAEVAKAFNTMSRQLEEFKARLERQNRDLKDINADLDKFIQIMAHDIADPLTVMIASCAYLEQHAGPSLSPKNLEALQGIRKASTKMHQMVKDLLQFTKSKRSATPA